MSGDIALIWNDALGAADIEIGASDLTTDAGLRTALLLSLFTDRRAEDGDVLPDGADDRRGWWGDAVPVVDGDRFGSRLWLLGRAKNTPQTLTDAETYAREALQWLIDDAVVERFDVSADFMTSPRGLVLVGTVYRPGGGSVKFRFDGVWSAEEARI